MEQVKVALIDNSDVYRDGLKDVLIRGGVHVMASVTHYKYEELFKEGLPDIVLVSYKSSLPRTLNTALWIKEKYAGGRVNVILYTMHKNLRLREEANEKGIKEVLFQQENDMINIIEVIYKVYHSKCSFKVAKKLKAFGRNLARNKR
jgi:DNA-binding NarL/FixJ family response regulator